MGSSNHTINCIDGLLLPCWQPLDDVPFVERFGRGLVYFFVLAYLFIGVSIISDRFMAAIEVITSQEKEMSVKKTNGDSQIVVVRIWNETVANLTLMALGSSAPEILLSVIEVYAKNFNAGDLGPGTIVGSAAYNLLVIIAICVSVIPNGEVRTIKHLGVFFVTATWSIFAYVWLYLILAVISPGEVEIWESFLTFSFFPLTVLTAYAADRNIHRFMKKEFRMNRRGVIVQAEGDNLEMVNTELLVLDDVHEDIKHEYINTLKELRQQHPHADLGVLEKMAHEMLLNRGPKSRAFYRIQATRKLMGSGDLMRRISERAQSDLSEVKAELQRESGAAEYNPAISRVYFDPAKYTVLESCGRFEVKVVRAGNVDGPLSVEYTTEDGTATAGSDYIKAKGMLQFHPGEKEKRVTLEVIDDDVFEPDEHFYVRLCAAQPSGCLGSPTLATVIILDDDHGGLFRFEHQNYELVESVGTFDLRVIRCSGARGRVIMPYWTEDGTAKHTKEYEKQEGQLIFENNESETNSSQFDTSNKQQNSSSPAKDDLKMAHEIVPKRRQLIGSIQNQTLKNTERNPEIQQHLPRLWKPKAEHYSTLRGEDYTPSEDFAATKKDREDPAKENLQVQQDDSDNLLIARILEGGMIEKQGLLHVGDVILEVNGIPVATPEDLQTEVAKIKDHVTLKVGSAPNNEITHSNIVVTNGTNGVTKKLTCYMRALFEYNPEEDTLLPCKEIGLAFDRGDILQIVDQRDPNWWQAKKIGGDGRTGLIPSTELEERRKAFVAPEADFVHKISICGARISKKKKKMLYQTKSSSDFDKAELLLYEEVTKMPPFKRKTLVLIGTQGVGRRTLKNRLINSDSDKFGSIIPYTSRPPRVLEENGQSYYFTDRETMEEDIKNNKYLEYGEYNGHLYGTNLDTIRDVIKQGKNVCVRLQPHVSKILHNSSEFLPFVIFIAAPGMEQLKNLYDVGKSNSNMRYSSRNLTFDRQSSIRYSSRRARTLESLASLYEEEDLKRTLEDSASLQRTYDKYINLVITNNDFDVAFRQIVEALESLTTEHQWVPVNWIY